jgi:hypothetical protein
MCGERGSVPKASPTLPDRTRSRCFDPNLLLVGPPGSGKTMLANSSPPAPSAHRTTPSPTRASSAAAPSPAGGGEPGPPRGAVPGRAARVQAGAADDPPASRVPDFRRSEGKTVRSSVTSASSASSADETGSDNPHSAIQKSPCSFKLIKRPSPTMTWSSRSIPTNCPASARRFVTSTSSGLGLGSPEGWLWTAISAAQLCWIASRNTSRGGRYSR